MSMALELDSKAHAHFSFSQSFLFLNPPKRKKMNKMPVNPPSWRNDTVLPLPNEVIANAWAVDAACSGNPGPMEYQCIDLQTGAQVFHYGPIHGTNNIGEFLAIGDVGYLLVRPLCFLSLFLFSAFMLGFFLFAF